MMRSSRRVFFFIKDFFFCFCVLVRKGFSRCRRIGCTQPRGKEVHFLLLIFVQVSIQCLEEQLFQAINHIQKRSKHFGAVGERKKNFSIDLQISDGRAGMICSGDNLINFF